MADSGAHQVLSFSPGDAQVAAATSRRRFKYLNFPFLIIVALLAAYGLIVVYSAVLTNDDYSFSRQLVGVLAGAVLMLALFRFDYHVLANYTVVLLVINVVLILSPHIPGLGYSAKGATSWISIAGFGMQPGEFAKLTVILMCASVMARYGGRLDKPFEYLKTLVIMAIPFVCIMTQPDLGTGMVYLFIAGVALIVGGAKPRFILITLGLIVALVLAVFMLDPVADSYFGRDVLLKEYQRARLLVFLDNSYDPTGDGYNLQQAQIAIGSGGFFGKGYLNASQSTLGYLPEAPTDFIFCVLAEELGFVGAIVLLGLYVALQLVCFRIASSANDLFGTVIVSCVAGMWLFQILENIGMTIGLMPITGIPLPFMSYGSSFMVVNFMLLGLVGSVWAHNGK